MGRKSTVRKPCKKYRTNRCRQSKVRKSRTRKRNSAKPPTRNMRKSKRLSAKAIRNIIRDLDKRDPLQVYNHVQNFNDLLEVNIAFLQGKINYTYYYGSITDTEPNLNPDTVLLLDKLVELHKLGFYTMDGQGSLKKIKNFNHIYTGQNMWMETEQKSYLQGYMKKEYVYDLLRYLQTQNVFYVFKDPVTWDILATNMDDSRYNVTRHRSHVDRYQLHNEPWIYSTNTHISFDDRGDHDYPNVQRILEENCVYFDIFVREYNTENVEDILLNWARITRITPQIL